MQAVMSPSKQLTFVTQTKEKEQVRVSINYVTQFLGFRSVPPSATRVLPGACLKRRHVYEAVWLSGRAAVWLKLILADVYQCLRRWPQPQGQNPQKQTPLLDPNRPLIDPLITTISNKKYRSSNLYLNFIILSILLIRQLIWDPVFTDTYI